MKTNKSIILSIILIVSTFVAYADEFKKNYHQEYKVTKNTTLNIKNRYGKVHIENWNKNTVSIDVTITVKANSKSKADKVINKIVIMFGESGNTVSAITDIVESIRNAKFRIDYNVKMPKDINLKLLNKYGNVFIDEVTGHTDIIIKYGNLKVNKLTRGNTKPLNKIYMAYSSGRSTIEDSNWLKVVAKYSNIKLVNTKALMIDSKYSKVKIRKGRSVVAESKYDSPFKIGEIKNFVCTGGYSSFEIDKLDDNLELNLKYSDFELNEVSPSFKIIDLKLKYGHADININSEASYHLKAHSAYGSVKHPKCDNISKIVDHTQSSIFGVIGKNKNTKSKVIIITKYGNVDITMDNE